MADPTAFVLPAGVQFQLDGNELSVTNAGDVVIQGNPSQALKTLRSESGSVHLRPDAALKVDRLEAPAGSVVLSGRVTVKTIDAQDVRFEGGTLKCEVIKASGGIELGAGKIEASILVADSVSIDSKAKGRATAISSHNELGPHKLKGGFSLAEFVDLMPGGADLLEAHGIEVPEEEDEDDDDDDDDDEPAASDEPAAEPPAAAAPGVPAEVRDGVTEALAKIQTAYEGSDVPPPIALLGKLVDGGDFAELKKQINVIWSDLLKHHQQTGLYISNTVTHMFQTIQLLMRKLD